MLDGASALRRGELFGLRWEDVDFEQQIVRVTHSIFRNVEGKTKTRASHKPVPLPPIVVEELKKWRAISPYHSDKDFLFPSIQKNGDCPIAPDMILRRHVRPALQRLGINKHIGWHSFRHGMSNLLRELQGGCEGRTGTAPACELPHHPGHLPADREEVKQLIN
jgi:integrase